MYPEDIDAGPSAVSTGHLPADDRVRALLEMAHAQFVSNTEGQNAGHYPALARVPRDLFGLCLVSVKGEVYKAGDALHPFTIMSVSKPFVFALACEALGPAEARRRLGVNSTGLPFNSIMSLELSTVAAMNPMVNAGAIAATSMAPGDTAEDKWRFIEEGLSRFAGRDLTINEEVYASASATNQRNRAIAQLLYSHNWLYCDPTMAVDLYTRQCSLDVTAYDLAVMAATLADGGVNPVTGQRAISADYCEHVLAVMATAGLYETSGDWLYEVGLPGKSGVGGGIITVSPGKGGLCTFAPPLDQAGNSVKGQLATRFLSEKLGLNLFKSRPQV